jgi:hypothetical protein
VTDQQWQLLQAIQEQLTAIGNNVAILVDQKLNERVGILEAARQRFVGGRMALGGLMVLSGGGGMALLIRFL